MAGWVTPAWRSWSYAIPPCWRAAIRAHSSSGLALCSRIPTTSRQGGFVPPLGSGAWSVGASTGAGGSRTSSPIAPASRPARRRCAIGSDSRSPTSRNPALLTQSSYPHPPWTRPALSPVSVDPPARRGTPPVSLAALCSSTPDSRLSHALGEPYRDVVRGFRGQIDNPPDVVAFPENEGDVERLLGWCAESDLAAIPYCGGTSVVGGVEPRLGGIYAGAVSIDLRKLDQV